MSGSTQPKQVIDAMQSAQDMYVPMDELEQKAGDFIANFLVQRLVTLLQELDQL